MPTALLFRTLGLRDNSFNAPQWLTAIDESKPDTTLPFADNQPLNNL